MESTMSSLHRNQGMTEITKLNIKLAFAVVLFVIILTTFCLCAVFLPIGPDAGFLSDFILYMSLILGLGCPLLLVMHLITRKMDFTFEVHSEVYNEERYERVLSLTESFSNSLSVATSFGNGAWRKKYMSYVESSYDKAEKVIFFAKWHREVESRSRIRAREERGNFDKVEGVE
jgi:hypothetical protein